MFRQFLEGRVDLLGLRCVHLAKVVLPRVKRRRTASHMVRPVDKLSNNDANYDIHLLHDTTWINELVDMGIEH